MKSKSIKFQFVYDSLTLGPYFGVNRKSLFVITNSKQHFGFEAAKHRAKYWCWKN